MQRIDWMIIVALVVLGAVAETALAVLTVTGASPYTEYIEFGIAMVFFVAVLIGSYLFVIVPTPQRRREERDTD